MGFTSAPPVPDGTPIAELSLPPHEETESAGGPRLGTNNAECVNAAAKSQELALSANVAAEEGYELVFSTYMGGKKWEHARAGP